MADARLKTAVLGLAGPAELLLKALSGVDYFQIYAVADRDSILAGKIAVEYNCSS